MRSKFKIGFLFLFFLNLSFTQEKLSFQKCIDLAFNNNPTIKSAILSEKIAEKQLLIDKAKILPSINGIVDEKYSFGRDINPVNNQFIDNKFKFYTANIGASFNLFSGFSVWNAIKNSKEDFEINKINIRKIKNNLTIDIAQKYISILYLNEIILANKNQIKESQKLLELAQTKFDSGVIAENNLFKVKAQKASEELIYTENLNQLEINFIDLKQLLNIPLNKEIEIDKLALLSDNSNLLEKNQFDLAKQSVLLNPNYLIKKIEEKKFKNAISIAKSLVMPTLNMKFFYGSNYTDSNTKQDFDKQVNSNLSYNVKFTLSIPIFNQFNGLLKIKQSKLYFEQAKFETQIQENKISKEVLQTISNTKNAKKRLESLEVAKEYNVKSYEGDFLKYQLGKININELNITKNNLVNVEIQFVKAKYELVFYNSLIKFYLGQVFEL